jgi:hypothetical protein
MGNAGNSPGVFATPRLTTIHPYCPHSGPVLLSTVQSLEAHDPMACNAAELSSTPTPNPMFVVDCENAKQTQLLVARVSASNLQLIWAATLQTTIVVLMRGE